MNTKPPEQIYLQCYDDDGSLLDLVRDDVTWCVDQINKKDAVYILATVELAALLEQLAGCAHMAGRGRDEQAADVLATRIREILDDSQA